jgi:hypothetical protein
MPEAWLIGARGTVGGTVTQTGLAVFVIVLFLVPVPILAWLDRGDRRPGSE